MDSLKLISLKKNKRTKLTHKKKEININEFKKYLIILVVILFIVNICSIYFIFDLKKSDKHIIKEFNKIKDLINMLENKIYNKYTGKISSINTESENNNNIITDSNSNSIVEQYIKQQNKFCDSPNEFYNQQYEDLIKLTDFSFKGISYQMYVYKKYDNHMSNEIIRTSKYEPDCMSNFYDALNYYAKKNNIQNNRDIYMLDIGGNIGAYPSFLGKLGYSVITFEASPRNYYIINKNYCHINRNSSIIIINRGISNVEKTCNYFSQMDGIGNGILLCDEDRHKIQVAGYNFNKTFEVKLTKLSNFLPYLSDKKIGLVKLDIEGGEGKAIEDGIELVNKYHVPFIFSEFNPRYLERHGTNPKDFLQLFLNNGYKITKEGFFSESYLSPNEINSPCNLYFIYKQN